MAKKNTSQQEQSSTTNPESNSSRSRLYRSETNKVIAGVCGGLGDYFNIDPTIIRILFVIITIFGGSGILIYIILWLVIPSESSVRQISTEQLKINAREMKDRVEKFAHDIRSSKTGDRNSKSWWAFLIIILGVIFLLNNYGYYDFSEISRLWPLLLVILGLAILLKK